MILLVSEKDFEGIMDVGSQTNSYKKLNPHIREVQRRKLRDVLNQHDKRCSRNTLPEGFAGTYEALLQFAELRNKNTIDAYSEEAQEHYSELWELVKPYLCFQALARMTVLHPVQISSYDFVRKLNPVNSEPISQAQLKEIKLQFIDDAESYLPDIYEHLRKYSETFPAWKSTGCCNKRDNNFNISISAI